MVLAKTIKRISMFHIISVCKHTLPELNYKYNALEPIIKEEIMQLHHSKHHATYVTNLNTIEEQTMNNISKEASGLAISLSAAYKFNYGGHINHSIFWKNLSPNPQTDPSGEFKLSLDDSFGTFDNFRKLLTAKTIAIQGSGWGWLGLHPLTRKLHVVCCANQDPLYETTGFLPLLGIDVWEHAYYLQYKNARGDYVNKLWQLIDWNDVEKRYQKALSSLTNNS